MLVADGISVSTAGSGNLASALLVQAVANIWEREASALEAMDSDETVEWLTKTLAYANQSICETSSMTDCILSRVASSATTV